MIKRIYPRGSQHPNWSDKSQLLTELKALTLGSLRVTGDSIKSVRQSGKSRLLVLTSCTLCGLTKLRNVDNLVGGRTKGCVCQRNRKYLGEVARILGERYDAIRQRCDNENSPSFRNYGARGIMCLVDRETFIRGMEEMLDGRDIRTLDIDRINNDGHYSLVNLRFVSRAENLQNRENSHHVYFRGEKVPAVDLWHILKREYPEFRLSPNTTYRLAREGLSVEDILARKSRRLCVTTGSARSRRSAN